MRAMAVSRTATSPRPIRKTAAWAASRAAVRAMCMSATMCWAAWNEAIGLPNWCRMVV